MEREFDIIAVGELLADFIGTSYSDSIKTTEEFKLFQGGSPANLVSNMTRLGKRTALIAAVGKDNIGEFLINEIHKIGVNTDYIIRKNKPSSIVIVARTSGTPDFVPYRSTDYKIRPQFIKNETLEKAKLFHTSCWPLSKEPSRSTVLDAARRAKKNNCELSLDLNYSPKIWPDIEEARKTLKTYLSFGPLLKLSDDDAERFFGEKKSEAEIVETLTELGAKVVCFTKGPNGSFIYSKETGGKQIDAKMLDIKDATGAGDSFWAGFLTAYLDNKSIFECGEAGNKMAYLKLQNWGPLPDKVDVSQLYN